MEKDCRAGRPGFTLIELLVVISIIALLISILLPALGRAREMGKVAKCQGLLKTLGQSSTMYLGDEDNGSTPVIPWYKFPAHGGTAGNPGGIFNISLYTPWVFGGFAAPDPAPENASFNVDSTLYPAQVRALNKYVSPEAEGDRIQLDVYKDPGDRSYTTSIIGQPGSVVEDEARTSWQANGSSFTLNTRFMQGYTWNSGGNFSLFGLRSYSERIAKHMAGGDASRFVMWLEQGCYSACYRAGPTLQQSLAEPQRYGWHREFSKWDLGFADGHAEYRYFDTRVAIHSEFSIWQPNWRTEDGG